MKYEEPYIEMLQIGEDVITTSDSTLNPDGNSGLDEGAWSEFGF